MGRFSIVQKTNHVVPTTYDDTSLTCPILQEAINCQSAIANRKLKIEMTHFERKKGWRVRHFAWSRNSASGRRTMGRANAGDLRNL